MTLKDELANDPLGIGYAGMTNAEIEVSLNTKNRTRLVTTMIGFGKILDALGPTDGASVLDTLEQIKATNSALKWAWYLLERGELDVALASTRGQIDVLASAGAMTTDQAAAIKALAETPCSRAEELGVVALDFDIMHARA